MWNEPNLTFLTLTMTFKSDSIKSFSSQFIVTILGKLHAKIKKKILKQILNKWTINVKIGESGKFRPFRPWKMTFRAIQSNPALGSWLVPSVGRFMPKEKKLLTRFWENCLKVQKGHTFWPLKITLRAIQPNPSYDMLLMSSQRSLMPKKRKSYWNVSEIGPSPPPPPLKLTPPLTPTDKSAFENLRCQIAQRS